MIRRLIDIIVACSALIVLSPLFLIIAILIKIDSEGEIFFRQERVGKDGKTFRIYKFRTMVKDAERKGAGYFIEQNDPRITRVGRFLRRMSLDELPQLINVFKGEMTLVGPRPTLKYQVDLYSQRQRKRLLVKPGLTGWAQIHGRNELPWPERIEMDVWYVENRSWLLDVYILIKTFSVLLKREGIYADREKFEL